MDLRGFNNDIDTLERAVLERVFYVKRDDTFAPPPRPEPGHFKNAMCGVFEQLRLFLPRTAPLTRAGFVSTFRGRKKQVYEAAAADLLRRSISAADAKLQVFVKYEKTDFTRKADPVPRVISPRSPRYNVEVGRFLRPLEERIFKSLAKLYGHATVMKGMNSAVSGRILHQKWCMFKHPAVIPVDAKRMDQHVSVDALRWEHEVYAACFPRSRHRDRLSWLLSMQLTNSCVGYAADGRLKYTVEGGRMSGDMNTSLGNCLLMCCMIYAYARSVGVRIQLANNGDDCSIFMEQADVPLFVGGFDAWFLRMGFSMEVEPACYVFEQIDFCQTRPVWVGPHHDSYLMVRHPKWGIAKDTMCVHNVDTPGLFRGWLHAVGTGGLSMTGGVPVFQSFYGAYLRHGKFLRSSSDYQSWGVRQLSKGMERQASCVLPQVRASFYWAFGVTPDEQLVLESFYDGVDLGGGPRLELSFQPDMPL